METIFDTPARKARNSRAARSLRCLGGLLAAAMFTAAAGASAAPASKTFTGKHFAYRADGKKLTDVLQDFASGQGLPVVIDPGVDGVVNGNFNVRGDAFLNAMAKTYGLVWYFDGTTLFVYPSRAMQSKVFRMRGYDRARLRQMLASLGLGDARFPLRFDDANQTLLAYGPPRHIELVSTVVEQLERDSRDRLGASIRVVALRYATAADRTIGSNRIPGLASTLNALFADPAKAAGGTDTLPPGSVDPAGVAERLRAVQSTHTLRPQNRAPASGSAAIAKREDDARANQLATAKPAESFDGERPVFQPDASSNSIIVRGLPDRMKEYEALVRRLDVPQDLVEIEASIIDVSSDEFDSLGVDWAFSVNGTQRLTVSPGVPSPSVTGSAASTIAGANITTLVGDAGRQLLSHIKALQGKGKAHILARPKVLGAVNHTATMSDKRTASVRVAGNQDANLFSIQAGTTLSVTPQIVAYDDHREVRLSLQIQDGDFEGVSVDQVPIVKQTEINTEATVREGESLLVGGISVESDRDGTSGVPGLSRIPLIGGLFRHREASRNRSERIFLLTPKIVGIGRPLVPAAATASAPASAASPASAPAPVVAPAPALSRRVPSELN